MCVCAREERERERESEREALYFCLLSGRKCVLFFRAPTYQSGPAGREQSSVGRRSVS